MKLMSHLPHLYCLLFFPPSPSLVFSLTLKHPFLRVTLVILLPPSSLYCLQLRSSIIVMFPLHSMSPSSRVAPHLSVAITSDLQLSTCCSHLRVPLSSYHLCLCITIFVSPITVNCYLLPHIAIVCAYTSHSSLYVNCWIGSYNVQLSIFISMVHAC